MTRTNCYWYHEYRDMNMTIPYCEEFKIDNPRCENECKCYISKDDADKLIRKATESLSAEPSGDLISREDAIAYIDRVTNSGLGRNKSLEYIRKYISALPSADVVEVKADQLPLKVPTEWINEGMVLVPQHDWIEMQKKLEEYVSADRPQVNSAEWVAEKEKEFEELHRQKGEWINIDERTGWAECSICGCPEDISTEPNFCSCCGADMRPEK